MKEMLPYHEGRCQGTKNIWSLSQAAPINKSGIKIKFHVPININHVPINVGKLKH